MTSFSETGAALIPAECFAPQGAKTALIIYLELQEQLYQDNPPPEFQDFLVGGLNLEITDNGCVYICSGEDDFCFRSFEYLVEELSDRNMLVKSFGLSTAFYCNKLRPGEHGGAYYRALPSGEILSLSTQALDDLTDEQFRHLVNVRESPETYTSAPDAS